MNNKEEESGKINLFVNMKQNGQLDNNMLPPSPFSARGLFLIIIIIVGLVSIFLHCLR